MFLILVRFALNNVFFIILRLYNDFNILLISSLVNIIQVMIKVNSTKDEENLQEATTAPSFIGLLN